MGGKRSTMLRSPSDRVCSRAHPLEKSFRINSVKGRISRLPALRKFHANGTSTRCEMPLLVKEHEDTVPPRGWSAKPGMAAGAAPTPGRGCKGSPLSGRGIGRLVVQVSEQLVGVVAFGAVELIPGEAGGSRALCRGSISRSRRPSCSAGTAEWAASL